MITSILGNPLSTMLTEMWQGSQMTCNPSRRNSLTKTICIVMKSFSTFIMSILLIPKYRHSRITLLTRTWELLLILSTLCYVTCWEGKKNSILDSEKRLVRSRKIRVFMTVHHRILLKMPWLRFLVVKLTPNRWLRMIALLLFVLLKQWLKSLKPLETPITIMLKPLRVKIPKIKRLQIFPHSECLKKINSFKNQFLKSTDNRLYSKHQFWEVNSRDLRRQHQSKIDHKMCQK